MNVDNAVHVIEYGIEHRKELAADAECAIHILRRIEHSIVKHGTTFDHLLQVADNALKEVMNGDNSAETRFEIGERTAQKTLVPKDARLAGSSSTN